MYYYNPYPDDITFKHEEMTGWEDDPEHTFNPTSDNAAFMKYVDVDQLYEHGGTNQWMADNSFYSGGQPQDITGISQQVVDLCNGDSIVLKGYSYGYVYWGITPEPFRMANPVSEASLTTWPVPANNELFIKMQLPEEAIAYTYQIFSMDGRLVNTGPFSTSGYLTILRNSVSSGVYLLQVANENGKIVAESKFIWE
jgi:hypothetical protein